MIKHIYVCTTLKHIIQQSLSNGIFPAALNIARVTGEQTKVSNYRPISDLPCFCRIMYTKLYEYLIKNKILYNKRFGFQKSNST